MWNCLTMGQLRLPMPSSGLCSCQRCFSVQNDYDFLEFWRHNRIYRQHPTLHEENFQTSSTTFITSTGKTEKKQPSRACWRNVFSQPEGGLSRIHAYSCRDRTTSKKNSSNFTFSPTCQQKTTQIVPWIRQLLQETLAPSIAWNWTTDAHHFEQSRFQMDKCTSNGIQAY